MLDPKKYKHAHVVDEWIELYQTKGYSLAQIGREYNCSGETVSKYFKMLNIPIKNNNSQPHYSSETIEKWKEDYLYGYSLAEVAKRNGTKAATVSKYLKKEGIEIRTRTVSDVYENLPPLLQQEVIEKYFPGMYAHDATKRAAFLALPIEEQHNKIIALHNEFYIIEYKRNRAKYFKKHMRKEFYEAKDYFHLSAEKVAEALLYDLPWLAEQCYFSCYHELQLHDETFFNSFIHYYMRELLYLSSHERLELPQSTLDEIAAVMVENQEMYQLILTKWDEAKKEYQERVKNEMKERFIALKTEFPYEKDESILNFVKEAFYLRWKPYKQIERAFFDKHVLPLLQSYKAESEEESPYFTTEEERTVILIDDAMLKIKVVDINENDETFIFKMNGYETLLEIKLFYFQDYELEFRSFHDKQYGVLNEEVWHIDPIKEPCSYCDVCQHICDFKREEEEDLYCQSPLFSEAEIASIHKQIVENKKVQAYLTKHKIEIWDMVESYDRFKLNHRLF